MPQIITGVSGVNRKAKKIPIGVSGVNRETKTAWTGVGGINRKVFSGDISSNIKVRQHDGNTISDIQSLPTDKNTYVGVYINEITGDICIRQSGSKRDSVQLQIASIEPFQIITATLTASFIWASEIRDDGTSSWPGGWFGISFNGYNCYSSKLNGQSIKNKEQPVYDLLGTQYCSYGYVARETPTLSITPSSSFTLTSTFERNKGISLSWESTTSSSNVYNLLQIMIPNKSLKINENPIDFLQCIRTTI